VTVSGEHPPKMGAPAGGTTEDSRVRMRVAPEAVIVVTRHNRIVLVDSHSWNMEEFNRREIVEFLVPEGFSVSSRAAAGASREPSDLPVEILIGRPASVPPRKPGYREESGVPTRYGTKLSLESALADLQDDPIIATLRDGTVVSWNAGARNLYGFAANDMLGEPVSRLIPPDLGASEERQRARVFEGESVSPYDTQRVAKDGASCAVCVSLAPILDSAGSIVGALEIGRDIAGRQRDEKALSDQVASLSQSNRELQDYAMVVAHDLQSPLNMVASCLGDLAGRCADELEKEPKDMLMMASAAVPRMQRLIKDLLDLARMDAQAPHWVPTDCEAIVLQALSNLDLEISQSQAKISNDTLPTVVADPTLLGQVFQNLISNAIKFRGSSEPRIHIGAQQRPGEWRFSISDNGIGIDPSMIRRLFQPLQRLQPDGPQPGSGLGLAIARKIMTRHGGRIWVESMPGEGSTFYFTLPVTDSKNSTESR
jgi:PAS domain S-box-containing protein